jgi:hypothetical protein
MSLCSGNNTTVDFDIPWNNPGYAKFDINRTANSNVSFVGAELTFHIGTSYDAVPIQTVTPPQVTLETETESRLVATLQISGAAIAAELKTKVSHTLYWQLEIASAAGPGVYLRGTVDVEPGFDESGPIVIPEIDPNRYPKYNPSTFEDGDFAQWDADTQTLVGNNVAPGELADTDDLAEGSTNLYYTDARFDAALGAAIAADFSASVQDSLALADSAVQSGDNISVLTNDAGYSTFSGAYADLSGLPTLFDGDYSSLANIPSTFTPSAHNQDWSTITSVPTNITQLGSLTADNGKVIGWSGGTLANLTISGGGDMLKSVYDSNDDGVIDVGAIPDLSGSYEAAGAVFTHVGEADPHPDYALESSLSTVATSGDYDDLTGKPSLFNGAYSSLTGIPSTFTPAAHNQAWSTITATPTTLAGYGITDAATSAQGTLADSALQSADIANFETTAELNARDTANRDRANHTGTQAQSTITGLVSDLSGKEPTVSAATTADYYRGDKSFQPLNAAAISDSTATGQALVTATDAAAAREAIGAAPVACIFSFNGEVSSFGFRGTNYDPDSIIGTLTRDDVGLYTVAITGLTVNAKITISSSRDQNQRAISANSLAIRIRTSTGNNVDTDQITVVVHEL